MQKQLMEVAVQPTDAALNAPADTLIIRISGEIGLTSMLGDGVAHTGVDGDTALDHALRSAVPDRVNLVILDLTSATYLSSLGISALARLKHRIEEASGSLRLAASPSVITLMRFGRLDQLFSVFPDVAAAVKQQK